MLYVRISQADNPNLPWIMGDMLQFICNPSPCVYEYDKFRIERPDTYEPGFRFLRKKSLFPADSGDSDSARPIP